MPLPARHLIEGYADRYYLQFRRPTALLETARGCPFQCNFCSVWKFHESTYRQKSPERIVQELEQIRPHHVFITDDIFWLHRERGEELARAIKAAGIRKEFIVQTPSDIVCKFPHLVEMWHELGRVTVFLGVEKVDDRGLEAVNKGSKAEHNVRAIEILEEIGAGFSCNYIVDPDWGHEDFDRLERWIERMNTYNAGFTVLTPLPREYVERTNLRIHIRRFVKELLRDERRTVGRLDSRFQGIDGDAAGDSFSYDPSYAAIQGPYTATLNDYVRRDLAYESDLPYEILTGRVRPWSFADYQNRYVNVAETLHEAMSKNAALKVFVANGYYDLATPYFATEYTFDHLGLDETLRDRVSIG